MWLVEPAARSTEPVPMIWMVPLPVTPPVTSSVALSAMRSPVLATVLLSSTSEEAFDLIVPLLVTAPMASTWPDWSPRIVPSARFVTAWSNRTSPEFEAVMVSVLRASPCTSSVLGKEWIGPNPPRNCTLPVAVMLPELFRAPPTVNLLPPCNWMLPLFVTSPVDEPVVIGLVVKLTPVSVRVPLLFRFPTERVESLPTVMLPVFTVSP